MIKCLFLIGTLGGGGAERVLVNLANHIDKTKFQVTIETMFYSGVNEDFLDPSVNVFCRSAPSPKGVSRLMKLIPERFLFRFFIKDKDYDVIIAYMHGMPVKVVSGCHNEKIKKVAWLHNGDPETGTFFLPWLTKRNAIKAYNSMDRIVGVSESVASAFADYTGISKEKVITKYNTNDTDRIICMAEEPFSFCFPENYPIICSVGGLNEVKGFDRLIEVAVKLHNEGYSFYLVIIGKGPQEKKLRQQINNSIADKFIKLLGFQENPYKMMKRSSFLVSASRSEGLATVLTEALTLGLPVVSTDVSGAKEVLGKNNEYGLVVDNSKEAIYKGLKFALDNKELMKHYSRKAIERSIMFNTKNTVKEVENMLSEIVEKTS